MAFVYKLTNTINNKSYIGFTEQEHGVRYNQHMTFAFNTNNKYNNQKVLYHAIRKYGKEVFEYSVLFEDGDRERVLDMESYFIILFNSHVSNPVWCGYNCDTGGRAPKKTQQQKDEHSRKMKGKKKPEGFGDAARERVSGEKNPMYGVTGAAHHSFGKKMSKEHCQKMSDIKKEYFKNNVHPNKGTTMSEEVKEKISNTKKKIYTVIKENGESFDVEDVDKFCKEEVGVTRIHLTRLSGKFCFCNGFRLLRSTDTKGKVFTYGEDTCIKNVGNKQSDHQKKSVADALAKLCLLEKPDGTKILIKNLRAAGRHYGFADGNITTYGKSKGFKLIAKNVIREDYSDMEIEDYS